MDPIFDDVCPFGIFTIHEYMNEPMVFIDLLSKYIVSPPFKSVVIVIRHLLADPPPFPPRSYLVIFSNTPLSPYRDDIIYGQPLNRLQLPCHL